MYGQSFHILSHFTYGTGKISCGRTISGAVVCPREVVVHVAVVDRLVQNGEIVSASLVRERVKQGAVRDIRAFVPDCTYAYFCAKEEEERVQTEKV